MTLEEFVEALNPDFVIPEWLKNMEFCHIDDGTETRSICGHDTTIPITCNTIYDGEAICPDCGLPTCPRCAQLEALEYELENT